ncbi:SGNH/GDSL hydrolase family protein [Streptomyces sp. SID1121]|uniref:SGNH/GDSL hydrolase family protein n=1 Tax=Streptomyces sp. SID1121 TaxID=3425888 RepID=UPI004055A651
MRLTHRAALACATAAAAFAVVLVPTSPALAESNGGVRVMPLGDSITDGFNVPGGYRTRLWERAAADRRRTDFVGSQFNGPAQLGDHDHEGHSGWRIDQIDAQATQWVRATNPRTVLLHIGTNDITQNRDVPGAPARLSALVDHITAAAPNADVFVTNIIPFSNATFETRAKPFNAAVPGIVDQWAKKGRKVHFVDMHSALNTADLADGIHPNAGGYAKMADRWYATLRTGPWI